MSLMFSGASDFDQDLGNWNIGNVTNMANMLDQTSLSTDNYDSTLIGWSGQTVQQDVTLGASGLTYCLGSDSRNSLTTTNGWTIGDSGYLVVAHQLQMLISKTQLTFVLQLIQ